MRISLPALSAKDRAAVRFANRHRLEYIALSFARSARDVKSLRRLLRPGLHIIAKIENQEGLDHADEILEAADGLMVARGDLGVEIPPERVPLAQKLLIRKANLAGKVVVTATEMLQSMMTATRPTRPGAARPRPGLLRARLKRGASWRGQKGLNQNS